MNNPLSGLMSFVKGIDVGGLGGLASKASDLIGDAGMYGYGSDELQEAAPWLKQAGAFAQQIGQRQDDAANGPPIQGQGQGPAGIPGFRGNNYGVAGDGANLPVQEIMSMLSGLMGHKSASPEGGGGLSLGGLFGGLKNALGGHQEAPAPIAPQMPQAAPAPSQGTYQPTSQFDPMRPQNQGITQDRIKQIQQDEMNYRRPIGSYSPYGGQ